MAFDFEWANTKLFFNEYTRSSSYFSNSHLAATGLPEGFELEYLQPYKDQLPPEVFKQPLTAFSTNTPNGIRDNLRAARNILKEAGWNVKGGHLVDREGKPFEFEILLVSPSFERVMAGYVNNLKKLGVKASLG
jgi:microcin C transport system substrate-binding protein